MGGTRNGAPSSRPSRPSTATLQRCAELSRLEYSRIANAIESHDHVEYDYGVRVLMYPVMYIVVAHWPLRRG